MPNVLCVGGKKGAAMMWAYLKKSSASITSKAFIGKLYLVRAEMHEMLVYIYEEE